MTATAVACTRRILVIDDNPAIHDDFRKILRPAGATASALDELEAALFGDVAPRVASPVFEVDCALQGHEGLDRLQASMAAGRPYDAAFVDVRMPPGWDGIETARRLWDACPELEIVICTAYADHSWEDTLPRLGHTDRLIVLKKPFDVIEVHQLAHALSEKARLRRQAQTTLDRLNEMVEARTSELAAVNARLVTEMRERKQIEVELRHVQKLESIGRLASGIAHELNTPAQFVSDNTRFLERSSADVWRALEAYRALGKRLAECTSNAAASGETEAIDRDTDLDYLRDEMPRAFAQTLEGVARITKIVRAMKEFGHPDSDGKAAADLNHALETTLVVARHEYKDVAEIETDLGVLPAVECHVSDLNQVFLNLIVNAAHAIAEDRQRRAHQPGHASPSDAATAQSDRGTIRIRTSATGSAVTIEIADNGCGIPEEIQQKVFEPFFTTKPVGVGTGQGLAIARSIVVDKHGGALTFSSEAGKGTTFRIQLPVQGRAS